MVQAWEPNLSPVPHTEALASPIAERTDNVRAHADMNNTHTYDQPE